LYAIVYSLGNKQISLKIIFHLDECDKINKFWMTQKLVVDLLLSGQLLVVSLNSMHIFYMLRSALVIDFLKLKAIIKSRN